VENILLLALLIVLLAFVAGNLIAGFVRWMGRDE